jgi:tetratricopeptide (TPR) repeat protein
MMARERNLAFPWNFVTSVLPWWAGGVALVVYLATLNHWVSLSSLGMASRIGGWAWRPDAQQPITSALFCLLRILPEPGMLLAMNLVSAVCAAAVIALLARSVALLPQDIAKVVGMSKEVERASLMTRRAWLPSLLAAVVCGLQISFWEHATSGTGEMIDLLVLAYVIRGLLEYRISEDESWLARCVFVYALGMANNWAMVGFLPVFLGAILRLRGFGILYMRPLMLRLALWALAGLSLYLLVPFLNAAVSHGSVAYWPALKGYLKYQLTTVGYLRRPAFRPLLLGWLLPLAVLSFRWRIHTMMDSMDSKLGLFLTKSAAHIVHAIFLWSAIWLALDPVFSPRHLVHGWSMLSSYYLASLVAGYCTGYFLLFGSKGEAQESFRPVVTLVYALLVFVPVALLERNLGSIRLTNGPALRGLARQLCEDLPAGRSAVLSDDPIQLSLVQAQLAGSSRARDILPIEGPALASAQYQAMLSNRFGAHWPELTRTNTMPGLDPNQPFALLASFAARDSLVYLHPAFGLWFEPFVERRHGLIHELILEKPGSADVDKGAGESDARSSTNEIIWQQRWDGGLSQLAVRSPSESGAGPAWARSLFRRLHLATEPNDTARMVRAVYAKSLDDWGVRCQREGRMRDAGVWFGRALELDPDNLCARINVRYHDRLVSANPERLDGPALRREFSQWFSQYENWREIMGSDGPVDEPTFLLRTGRVLLAGGMPRQAARELTRCMELAPDWVAPRLSLAQARVQLRDFAGALSLTETLAVTNSTLDTAGQAQLVSSRVGALRGLGRTNEATSEIAALAEAHPDQGQVLDVCAELYTQGAQFPSALALLEELVRREPSRGEYVVRKGFAELQSGKYEAARATLTTALAAAPGNENARLYRALAALGADQLEAARADYQELLQSSGHWQNALFGLGAVAWRSGDTNAAIGYYERYISNSPARGMQHAEAVERLKQLRGGPTQSSGK